MEVKRTNRAFENENPLVIQFFNYKVTLHLHDKCNTKEIAHKCA